ncbi:hypothetical protein MtrunA17_Chr5g0425101 [Medicago truncatula]|uniref:Uncharacterized protein n=1 Tax=Medicago truncatula TaxID=3880 RepID=G7KA03_MEDTR|nr:hypothetical protein MTR_5g061620 [Medicago truncatula]RHN56044.1 hypothetical protein MtrunA17_Chr5g0425101 [Medicago truncatula]
MAVGVDVAEACVLRKMCKEKMKEGEEAKGPKNSMIEAKTQRSSGCLFWFSKKLGRITRIRDINETERKKKVLIR